MDISFLNTCLTQGESDILEFRASLNELQSVAETLCGFLNHRGGFVLVGVDPSGVIHGVNIIPETEQLINEFLKRFDPPGRILVSYVVLPNSSRKVIVFQAQPVLSECPYTFNSQPYQRLQLATAIMTQPFYQQLLLERASYHRNWENLVTHFDIDYLDDVEITKTKEDAIRCQRLPNHARNWDIETVLSHLHLLKSKKIINAAIVLFCRQMSQEYEQCNIKMARFEGSDKLKGILSNKLICAHAFKILNEALAFIKEYSPITVKFSNQATDATAYIPLEVVKEILVNAICHRDYSYYTGEIALAIYDDRMEVWNSGILPLGLQINDLSRTHASLFRNPIITNVFFLRGLSEKWGTGTQKIIKQSQEAGLPTPEFFEDFGGFGVRIWFQKPRKMPWTGFITV